MMDGSIAEQARGAGGQRPLPRLSKEKKSIVARDHVGVALFLAHLGFNAVSFPQERRCDDGARAAAGKRSAALEQQKLIGIMGGKVDVVHHTEDGDAAF